MYITNGKKSNAIIVLGNKLTDNGLLSLQCRERCFCAYGLYKNDNNSFFILSGGITNQNINKSEALAMEEYLIALGVNKSDIILEEKSTNTYQNAKFCNDILKNMDTKKIIVVSSSEHIYRWSFNPIRFFNSEFALNVDYKSCMDSGIECVSFNENSESIFIIVRNHKDFLQYIADNKDKNIFYKYKGHSYRIGNKTIMYQNKDKEIFINHIKKLYKIDKLEIKEI